MFLKRSITVNWGNLPPQELNFGPINLFSGGNGSGKTTGADALQTLMTAAHDNLFNYNPGQDETTQRGRGGKQVRTLASYVLGCDDGAFARPDGCDGYIAGVFHPTKGETAEPFTAVIGVRARVDNAGSRRQARQSELLLMIVAGEMLSLSDFLQQQEQQRHVVAITKLPNLLRQRFGKKAVEVYPRKGAYLARLYGALRGKPDAVSQQESKNAARTFARFMAYKPVQSIDQFVANEVLEAHDMGDTIRRIRDLLGTVHGMEKEARRLRTSVDLLAQARKLTGRYLDDWQTLTAQAYGACAQQWRRNQRLYLERKHEQARLHDQQQAKQQEASEVGQRLEQSLEELIELKARIRGIPALHNQQQLEARRDALTKQLHAGARPLLDADQQRNENIAALRNIHGLLERHQLGQELPQLASRGWQTTCREVLAAASSPLPDLNQMLARDWIDLTPLEASFDAVRAEQLLHNRLVEMLEENDAKTPSTQRLLERLVAERSQTLTGLAAQQKLLEKRISTLEARHVSYPHDVEEALAAIRSACPAADARVLCDHVEVNDPVWQMAIEGYIGGARFGILVEADYEACAIQIVRRLAGKKRSRARVIQGEKAQQDAAKMTLPPDSVFHLLRFSHRTAENYLKASYGQLLRVDSAAELRHTRRGISADGLGSGNYALFRCDLSDDQLVFGEAARARNLAAQQKTQQQLQHDHQQANDAYQAVKQLADQLSRFKPMAWIETAAQLLTAQQQLDDTDKALAQLDLSDHAELQYQQQQAQQRHQQLEARQGDLKQEQGQLVEKLGSLKLLVDKLAGAADGLQQQQQDAAQALRDVTRFWPGLDVEARLAAIDERLDKTQESIDFAAEERTLTERLNRHAVAIDTALNHYNAAAAPTDVLLTESTEALHCAAFFGHIHHLDTQLDGLHNRLLNNVLLAKQENLASLRDSFNTTFVSDLCSEVHQSIRAGERSLNNLNDELEHHRFGADRESFRFSWQWLPEYKEYWDFFREVIELPNLGDGTSLFDAGLSDKAAGVRDKLLALLLDGNEQQALHELERISDYRCYRRYDILKQPENKPAISLSEYGTGSGGQLETPAYIIRAAAITSALRFNEGASHLRMVIVDEAFMHMDETRSRGVIDYLTNTLGLQLIFIMPTSKTGPYMDLISNQFVFSKVPSPVPVGELNTRVLVDRQQLNQERISELWAQHRRVIRQQGALDFMEDI